MAGINLKKEEIETAIVNINKNVSILNDQFNSICNQVDMVKSVWVDDIGLFEHITSLLNSIRAVNRDYKSFCDDFTRELQNMVLNYETIDKNINAKFSSGDVVSMTLGAMAFKNFDFSKTANKATNLASNNFLNEKSIHKEMFTDGDYKLNYLDNGVVRIDKDGQPMIFTTKENAEKLINLGSSESSNIGSGTKVGTPSNATNSGTDGNTTNTNSFESDASSNATVSLGDAAAQKFFGHSVPDNAMLLSPNSKFQTRTNKSVEGKIDTSNLYTYDKNGRASLNMLHPEAERKKDQLVEACAKQGIPIKITESVRSVGRQDQLYAQGRTAPGSKVTNAKGSSYSSNHQWGIAFDVCMANGDPYDVDKLKQVGEIGKSIGLEWGGDWTTIVDMPHFQLPDYGSGTKEIKATYGTPDNFANTWYEDK